MLVMTVDSMELTVSGASADIISTVVNNTLNGTLGAIAEAVAITSTSSNSSDILGLFDTYEANNIYS